MPARTKKRAEPNDTRHVTSQTTPAGSQPASGRTWNEQELKNTTITIKCLTNNQTNDENHRKNHHPSYRSHTDGKFSHCPGTKRPGNDGKSHARRAHAKISTRMHSDNP